MFSISSWNIDALASSNKLVESSTDVICMYNMRLESLEQFDAQLAGHARVDDSLHADSSFQCANIYVRKEALSIGKAHVLRVSGQSSHIDFPLPLVFLSNKVCIGALFLSSVRLQSVDVAKLADNIGQQLSDFSLSELGGHSLLLLICGDGDVQSIRAPVQRRLDASHGHRQWLYSADAFEQVQFWSGDQHCNWSIGFARNNDRLNAASSPSSSSAHDDDDSDNDDAVVVDGKLESLDGSDRFWWLPMRERLLEAMASRDGRACYAYSEQALANAANRVLSLRSVDRCFYAMKANSEMRVLELLEARGFGFECVSPDEIARVQSRWPELPAHRILFTPNFAPRSEYVDALARGVWVTVDSMHALEQWPDVFAGRDIFVRLDTGKGDGHHRHVRTAGAKAKFGIALWDVGRLCSLVADMGARVVGLHAHVGSGILRAEAWGETARLFGELVREHFPHVRHLDVGGGFGVVERDGQRPLDMRAVDALLADFKRTLANAAGIELWVEPGRYVVAECGVLLGSVTQLKRKAGKHFVGINTGFNSLIRPALYNAYHAIYNLTRIDDNAAPLRADVVGPICETGDVFGRARPLPSSTGEGDIILIGTAGAYGQSMSNSYNLRRPADPLWFD
jgi:diaminopimelate decarboxylase